MNRKILLASVAVAALMAAQAQVRAADVMGQQYQGWSPTTHVSARNWQGLYAGGHVGAGATSGVLAIGSSDGKYSTGGALAGLQLGYNWDRGNWVWGLEGDVSFSGIDHNDASHGVSANIISSIRARLGMPVGQTLVYVTGGAGMLSGTTMSSTASVNSNYSVWRPVAGLGVEAWLTDSISARAEGLAFFGTDKPHLGSNPNSIKTAYVARIGLNFHFNK